MNMTLRKIYATLLMDERLDSNHVVKLMKLIQKAYELLTTGTEFTMAISKPNNEENEEATS